MFSTVNRPTLGAVTPVFVTQRLVARTDLSPSLWPLIWAAVVATMGVGSTPERGSCLCREIKGPGIDPQVLMHFA